MHILPITIKNKAAEYTGTEELVCYNSDYRIKFSFDADFAAYDAKTVRFWYYDTAGDKQTIDSLFTGDEVDVPVIPAAMVLYVGVYAGNIRTSTDAEIPCRYSILSPDGAELEPNPDVYHQLLEAVETQLPGALSAAGRAEKAADEAEEIVDTARDILQAAGDGIATIQGYVNEANTAASNAVDAKNAAESARDLAKQYADDANTAKTAAETAEANAEASKTAAQGYADVAETSANRADATSTNLRKYGNELATAMKSQYDVVVDKAIETKESARQASNNAQAAKDARDIANTFSADAKAAATRSANAADHAENYAIHQPTIGDNKNWYVWNGTEYTDTGYLSHGEAGIAPHIGNNGNWYIGETDTGVYASGSRTAVKYEEQTLTADEQKQARRNIDAQKQVYAVSKGNPWSADDCVNAPVRDLKLYGASEQNGIPTPDNPIPIKCNNMTYTLTDGADYNGGSVTAPELYAIGDIHDEWDAVTGKGIRRIKKLVLDGTEAWGNHSNNGFAVSALETTLNSADGMCNQLRVIKSFINQIDNSLRIGINNNIVYCVWNSFNDSTLPDKGLANWKAHLNEHPLEIYYPLNTPEEFTTTPASQLTTPEGYAQMLPSGDGVAGETELEYAIDVEKRYIPKIYFEDIFISQTSSIMRRNIYRGKNLGTEVTPEQKAAIQSGEFDGLFIGDYWVIDNIKYLIADMDYWYNMGNTAFTKHHLVIIPDEPLYKYKMNNTNTTAGGYVGSLMYTEGLNQAKDTITAAFGDMVLTHREYLTNAVSGNCASAGAWYDSNVELMSEIMAFGSNIFGNKANGTSIPYNYVIDKQQLALFRLCPTDLHKRQTIWLRDVASSSGFVLLSGEGITDNSNAWNNAWVRPVFPLG